VLPRLALDRIVTLPAEPWFDDTPIAFAPDVWRHVAADRAGTAARLLDAAVEPLARAETGRASLQARVPGGSRIASHGLVKAYKGRRVVDDVSVELEQGEIVGLLGPNGAGKTTTFYMFTGLVQPDRGTIEIDGKDITRADVPPRYGLGYLAQEAVHLPPTDRGENVAAIAETTPLSPEGAPRGSNGCSTARGQAPASPEPISSRAASAAGSRSPRAGHRTQVPVARRAVRRRGPDRPRHPNDRRGAAAASTAC
jgi:hypothetical protein